MPWTVAVTRFLPGYIENKTFSQNLSMTMRVLGLVLVLGFVWEFLYHLLQQFRWEKDWPVLFALLVGIPEGHGVLRGAAGT